MIPKVSIGVPVWNGEKTLRGALASLCAQTVLDFEMIISDDCSSDTSASICQSFAAKDGRIRCVRHESNIGLVANFAYTLKEARGNFFMWAAQDDWWHEDFINKLLFALEGRPEHGVAMSHAMVFGDDIEKPLPTIGGNHQYTDLKHAALYKSILSQKGNPFFEYGLWRTDVLRKVFSRGKPKCIEDTKILMCQAALTTRFASVPEVLYLKYRNPAPLYERHQYLGKYNAGPFSYWRFALVGLFWLLSSPSIPMQRKLSILLPWFKHIKKRKLWREIIDWVMNRRIP